MARDEEVQEESIEDLLVELKDTSELMIDLAYSALLLQSMDLAKELLEMEEYIDDLHTKYELAVLRRKAVEGGERGTLGLIRLGLAAENMADAAAEIAGIVLYHVPPHPVLQMVAKEGEDVIEMAHIYEGSILDGKTLEEASLEDNIGMKVIAVRRGARWTYNPSATFRLHVGDLIVARGYAEGRELLKSIALGEVKEV